MNRVDTSPLPPYLAEAAVSAWLGCMRQWQAEGRLSPRRALYMVSRIRWYRAAAQERI